MNESIVVRKSFDFAIKIVNFYKRFSIEKKEYVLSKQFLRSGTSIGANVREAQNAQSKMDFIHKLAIAQKECDETIYWFQLLKETDFINSDEADSLINDATELLKIIRSIIVTTKKNLNSK